MHFTLKKKSSEPLREQQQDRVHSRDVYHTAKCVAEILVKGEDTLAGHFN